MVDYTDLTPAGFSIAESLITGRTDPQLIYMWEVQIEGSDRARDFESSIVAFARQASIPQRSVGMLERRFLGEPVTHAGYKDHNNNFRCTFWDDRSLQGYRYFNSWFNAVSDPQRGRQAKNEVIKRDMSLKLKDRTDFFLGAKIDLKGCIIQEIAEIQLSYEESAPLQYQVTFKFDEMLINDTTYITAAPGAGTVGDIVGGLG